MQRSKEQQRKQFVRECLKEYYEEDRQILIDSSICKVFCTKFIIGDLIYFGNKILIPEEEFETIRNLANDSIDYNIMWKAIRKKNAQSILNKMEKDTHDNIKIVSMPKAKEKVDRLEEYLKDNPSILLYLQDMDLYKKLREKNVRQQLYLMYEGMKDIGVFTSKFKFETIDAIHFENAKMVIYTDQIRTSEIKVFDSKGKRRHGKDVVEVNPRDFIVIKSYKEDGEKSIKIYEVVSRHSRKHASLILWTHLKEHETTNWYIEQLPYMLQSIIKK